MRTSLILAATAVLASIPAQAAGLPTPVVYPTWGVHNPPSYSTCANPACLYTRKPGEPSDPEFPAYWQSRWNMYRVYGPSYGAHMPPYDGKPPAPLKNGVDYETSQGATYYDSTWRSPRWPGQGAMKEHYEKRCLPIFAFSNHYSCSFVSLGDTAFFVTYKKDRPKGMPPVCLFSAFNHPPERNFIAHLPYAKSDSDQLHDTVQGYSFWVQAPAGTPFQTGASPDQTDNGGILFGYALKVGRAAMRRAVRPTAIPSPSTSRACRRPRRPRLPRRRPMRRS